MKKMNDTDDIRNLLILISVIAGIVAGSWLCINPLWWFLIFLTVVTGLVIFTVLNRQKSDWLILMAIFCLSGFGYAMAHQQYDREVRTNKNYNEQWVRVTGVQIQRSEATLHGIRFVLQTDPNGKNNPRGKLMVYYNGEHAQLKDSYGRKIQVFGKLKVRNFPCLKFPDYSEQQGIAGNLFAERDQAFVKGRGLLLPYLWAEQIREKMIRSGRDILSPINSRLLHGMIFNDDLSSETGDRKLKNELRRTGTIHLMSVSGLHVGFLVIGLTWFFSFLRIPKRLQIIPLVLGVGFYIIMTGMEPPVLRAGIMMIIYTIGNLFGANTKDQVNRLALAAVVLLFWDPYYLFQIGFQLSFIATLGVVWLYPVLREYFPVRSRLIKPLWDALLVSISAQIMVTPIIIHYFQQVSWCSPLANLLFFLPSEFIILGGLMGEGLALLLPAVARWILIAVDWNLTIIRWVAHFLAGQSWAASWSPDWPWPWIIGYYVALILILELSQLNILTKKRLLNAAWITLGILGLVNLIVWTAFLQLRQGRYLEFTTIDVGQGDALFIRSPEGVTLLIDGGDEGKGISKVVPFLRSAGVERVDIAIATHGHRDHIAGLAEVLEEVPARKLYLPANTDTLDFQDFLARIEQAHIPCQRIYSGKKFRLGTEVTGLFLNVPGMEGNDGSVVMLLQYGKNKLLLTGDLSEQGETVIARKYSAVLRASVLKVGHHGSLYASSLSFVTQVKPQVGIVSVGAGNRYGHPGESTIRRLHSLGVHLYRTDRQGQITVRMYGKKFTVTTYK
jgi:competence protein ComEC